MMRILFLGEGEAAGPARYFLAIARHARFRVDHAPDRSSIPSSWLKRRYGVIALSDYRHASFSADREAWVLRQLKAGTGLLMIGGWASFTGNVGGYAGSKIESALPVRCRRGDDRVNYAGGVAVVRVDGRSFKSLDWKHPPIVCGYHLAHPKKESKVLLAFRELRWQGSRVILGTKKPALVTGNFGRARTAAFLTDCAPHWAGGLVDWGRRRVRIKLGAKNQVEVGASYLGFFKQLLEWTAAPAK
jgi:uncharacterized membrane protein